MTTLRMVNTFFYAILSLIFMLVGAITANWTLLTIGLILGVNADVRLVQDDLEEIKKLLEERK
jgi:hypothetical protein